MTEDVKQPEGIAIKGEAQQSSQSPTVQEQRDNAVVERASKSGWQPLEDYIEAGKDPADWVSAQEFVNRQPLFDKIHSLKNELFSQRKTFEKDFKVVTEHFKSVKETEYKRALDELKSQRTAAIESADSQKANQIDEQMDKVREEHAEFKAKTATQATTGTEAAEFVEWRRKNQWYDKDSAMKREADSLGIGYAQANPSVAISQVLEYVEERIKRLYPETFGESRKESTRQVSAVEGGGIKRATKSSGKVSVSDLNDMERTAMDTFIKRGVLTEAQYLESIGKARGLKN